MLVVDKDMQGHALDRTFKIVITKLFACVSQDSKGETSEDLCILCEEHTVPRLWRLLNSLLKKHCSMLGPGGMKTLRRKGKNRDTEPKKQRES